MSKLSPTSATTIKLEEEHYTSSYEMTSLTTASRVTSGMPQHQEQGTVGYNQYDNAYVTVPVCFNLTSDVSMLTALKPKGPMRPKGYMHLTDTHTIFKWEHPHFYRT
jgi:hypothetical protein